MQFAVEIDAALTKCTLTPCAPLRIHRLLSLYCFYLPADYKLFVGNWSIAPNFFKINNKTCSIPRPVPVVSMLNHKFSFHFLYSMRAKLSTPRPTQPIWWSLSGLQLENHLQIWLCHNTTVWPLCFDLKLQCFHNCWGYHRFPKQRYQLELEI